MSNVDTSATRSGGQARSSGISWQELMATESRPVPECLTHESYAYRGSEPLAAARYTSTDFMRRER